MDEQPRHEFSWDHQRRRPPAMRMGWHEAQAVAAARAQLARIPDHAWEDLEDWAGHGLAAMINQARAALARDVPHAPPLAMLRIEKYLDDRGIAPVIATPSED